MSGLQLGPNVRLVLAAALLHMSVADTSAQPAPAEFRFERFLNIADRDASAANARLALLQRFPSGTLVDPAIAAMEVREPGRAGECEQRTGIVFCRHQHLIPPIAGLTAADMPIADWWITITYNGEPRSIADFRVQLGLR